MSEFLIELDNYLQAGLHMGTKQKLSDMKKYISGVGPNGLYL